MTPPKSARADSVEHLDVIVVGGGLSGIAAGYRVQHELPGRSYAVLEARSTIGGTWDLFRYPGIRSDSDMFTMGYSFAPWLDKRTLADGAKILSYIKDTSEKYGISSHVRLNHRVEEFSWSDEGSQWTVTVARGDGTSSKKETVNLTCTFLFVCTGYYDYDGGYAPDFPNQSRFRGRVVHPQHWPQDLDVTDKNVVVIGSGATAITLVPAMSDKVKHITMLQRSPTYVASLPGEDPVAVVLMAVLPVRVAHFLNRWKNIVFGTFWYWFCKSFPRLVKRFIVGDITRSLGPEYEKHFSPSYNPWDQRFCVVPDGDLFKAIKSGKASVVTDTIETFTETGIKVHGSPEELPADVVVTATGLRIKLCGGIRIVVNGKEVNDMKHTFMYKGVMLSGVPNFILSVGYTNLTFTLKVDLIGTYMCRLLRYMDRNGYRKCCPHYGIRPGETPEDEGEDLLDLTSGYLRRSMHLFPRQGLHSPWRYYQNYFWDMWEFRFGWLNDGVMKFT